MPQSNARGGKVEEIKEEKRDRKKWVGKYERTVEKKRERKRLDGGREQERERDRERKNRREKGRKIDEEF